MNPGPAIDAMRTAERAMTGAPLTDQIRAIQAAEDALAAAKAERLAALRDTATHDDDGCSTVGAWVRTQLRMTPAQARMLVRGATTMTTLPEVGTSARAGRIRPEHVDVFGWALKKLGVDITTTIEHTLVREAETSDPATFRRFVAELHARVNTDALDDAYDKSVDAQDFTVVQVGDTWTVRGTLNPVTGTKLRSVLDALSAPTGPDDQRTAAQRRVQAVDDLTTSLLENGLPSDQGIRPQTHVLVDADTLADAHHRADADAVAAARRADGDWFARNGRLRPSLDNPTPARLKGHGPVGPRLLGYLTCVSDLTALLTSTGGGRRRADVLDVGRTHRLATAKQRHAVHARQAGVCAAPGCSHTHLEIHHIRWWSRGGPTNLDNLIGLCSRCHHLLHRDKLHLTGTWTDGYRFTNQHGRPLEPEPRTSYTTAA